MTIRKTLFMLAAIATLAGCGSTPSAPKRIVLVTIDAWHSDALGASGSGRVKTPNLDALAKSGHYVPKAWSSATLTAPSHASILTGLQRCRHGVRDNHGFRMDSSIPTLAALLRQKGYATAAFVSADPLAPIMGLDGRARVGGAAPAPKAEALRSLGHIGAGGEGMDPKNFAPLYVPLNEVRALCDARRFAEAVPIYKQLLTAFPRSSLLACELGLIEMALGNPAEAELHLRLALDRNPGNSHALLGMANLALLRDRGDTKAAERLLLDVLKVDPDDVEADFKLDALYVQNLAEPAKAVRDWQRSLERQPGDPEAPRIRGLLENIKR